MKAEHILKQDWKEKIEKELRGRKNLADLVFTIQDGMAADPLLQEEDRIYNDELSTFPDHTSFGLSVNHQDSNKAIIESLKCGASSICIHGHKDWQWNELLDGIHLDYIKLFLVADENYNNVWKAMGIKKDLSERHITIVPKDTLVDVEKSFSGGTLTEDISRIVNFSPLAIILHLSDQYILNIALLRAIRIMFQKNKSDAKIIVRLTPKEISEEYDLIQFSAQAMSAMAGGADYIFYPFTQKSSPQQVAKMMHVQNVITMESHATAVKDPWKGAYLIEHITQILVREIT